MYNRCLKLCGLVIIIFLSSCSNNSPVISGDSADTALMITTDTISEIRTEVNSKPVASYLVPVNDPKLERSFGVEIYETINTFEYLMRLHYEAVEETDTLKIPNFGIWPVVRIVKGPEKISCVIGFLDKNKQFKQYKMVTASGNKMRIIVLKKYAVGRYRTPVK